MEHWETWQILLVMALMCVKYFIIGSIWGSIRARNRLGQQLRRALTGINHPQ